MDIDCKKFSKVNSDFKRKIRIQIAFLQDLRSLDKSMREWHAYKVSECDSFVVNWKTQKCLQGPGDNGEEHADKS